MIQAHGLLIPRRAFRRRATEAAAIRWKWALCAEWARSRRTSCLTLPEMLHVLAGGLAVLAPATATMTQLAVGGGDADAVMPLRRHLSVVPRTN